jgi:two-component system, cell cycle response regulator
VALILVVDDIQDNRTLLQLDLEDDGHEVILAENGEIALRKLEENDVDLVLLDINMPVMNGIDFLKSVKKNPAHENLPVIMVTANDMDELLIQALDLGANDYIVKPYSYPVLAARLRTSLRLKRALDNLRRANKRLEVMATIDSLTGLYVRRHFFELANKEVAKCLKHERVMTIAVLDVDRLKRINEEFSQDAGDSVLIQLAERIRETVQQSDIVARIEGDAFAICMPDTAIGQAQTCFEKLIAAVAENPLSLSRVDKSRAASISCSVGLACYRLPEDDIAAAWRRADSALFAAKKRGGNAVDIATNE